MDTTSTVTVTRPSPADTDVQGYGLPVAVAAVCPPCDAPLTCCGFVAQSPLVHLDGECGGGIGCALPIITPEELAGHPRNTCSVADVDPAFLSLVIQAVSDKIADHYGMKSLAPCYDTRCVRVGGRAAQVDGLLRLDKVEIADGCACHRCDVQWRELRLCDLVVGPHEHAPWTSIASCDSGLWCGGHLRVTGIWGDVWPIHGGVKLAAVLLTVKTILNASADGAVISNRESGQVTVDVPDFDFAELGMLPSSLFRRRGWGV